MKFQLLSFAAAASVASALSSGCTTQVALLAFGDLGSCLQLTSALSVLSSSGSLVTPLNTYLTSLCASSTPTCSSSTLTSANTTIASGCSSDISAGGTDAATITTIETVLAHYPQFYTAACSKNSTTGAYCLTSTLSAIQNSTGTNVTFSTLSSLLSGSSSGLSSLGNTLTSGQLCTGCVGGFYQQAIAANASITSLPAASSIASVCGTSFGKTVTGVSSSSPASSSTASSASSSAASSSKAAGYISSSVALPFPVIAAAMSIVAGVAVGGLAVM